MAGSVVLANCKIEGLLDLEGAKLNGIAYPNHPDNALYAESISVKGHVWLRNGFEAFGPVVLTNATVDGNLDCRSGTFSQPEDKALVAAMSHISGSVYLTNGFQSTGEVDLRDAVIGHDLSCEGGQFIADSRSSVALSGIAIKVGGSVRLGEYRNTKTTKTKVDAIVDLTDASIQNTLYLTAATDLQEANLCLSRARVGTLSDLTSMWPKQLHLNEFVFDALDETGNLDSSRLKQWLLLNRPDKFQPQPYEQMATALRRIGHADDSSEILIEKNVQNGDQTILEDERRLSKWVSHGPVYVVLNSVWLFGDMMWYKVLGRAIGFGYQAWTAFFVSIVVIMVGRRVFLFAYKHRVIVPASQNADDQKGHRVDPDSYDPAFNAFVYSLETFLPLLQLGISKAWAPSSSASAELCFGEQRMSVSGRALRAYLWVHICAGWVLTTLWVGASTGILKL